MTTTEPTQLALSRQGYYSGPVTRLAAFTIDQAVITAVFTVVVAFTRYAFELVTRDRFAEASIPAVVLGAGYTIWWFVYFAYPWAVSGKSLGMAVLGIRVVRRDGGDLGIGGACVRALTLPLGFVTLGIGFLGIVLGREHRALHDQLAGSAVVYNWDARAARLRFLAGPSGTAPGASSTR